MTARLFLGACLFASAAVTAAGACVGNTGGTCLILGCEGWRNSKCEDGNCVCKDGECAFGGKCMKTSGCDRLTQGTCAYLGCNSCRGSTTCDGGVCRCKPGACMYNNVCWDKCPKSTGGFCRISECKAWRGAECSGLLAGSECLCGADKCSTMAGKCVSPDATDVATALWASQQTPVQPLEGVALFIDQLPESNDPVWIAFLALGALLTAFTFAVLRSRARRSIQLPEEVLG